MFNIILFYMLCYAKDAPIRINLGGNSYINIDEKLEETLTNLKPVPKPPEALISEERPIMNGTHIGQPLSSFLETEKWNLPYKSLEEFYERDPENARRFLIAMATILKITSDTAQSIKLPPTYTYKKYEYEDVGTYDLTENSNVQFLFYKQDLDPTADEPIKHKDQNKLIGSTQKTLQANPQIWELPFGKMFKIFDSLYNKKNYSDDWYTVGPEDYEGYG